MLDSIEVTEMIKCIFSIFGEFSANCPPPDFASYANWGGGGK